MDHRLDKYMEQQDKNYVIDEVRQANIEYMSRRGNELDAKALEMWRKRDAEYEQQLCEFNRGLRVSLDYDLLHEMDAAAVIIQQMAYRMIDRYHRALYRNERQWLETHLEPL